MASNTNLTQKISAFLYQFGSPKRIERSRLLELNETLSYNFRSLDLKASEVIAIAHMMHSEHQKKALNLNSITFSYNPDLGDTGAVALSKSLPNSLTEIGLVGCGIGDVGGTQLLEMFKRMPQLTMACIENNQFSNTMKQEFKMYSKYHPQILIVV
jgi:hypothetical protein